MTFSWRLLGGIFAIALPGFGGTAKLPATETSVPLPQILAPLAGAQAVEQVMAGHGAAVTYTLQVEYPAESVIDEINSRAARSGWQALSEDFLNPGLPTSHVRGWTSYFDLSRGPRAAMHTWQSGWRNADGDLLEYSFWYRTENVHGQHAPETPGNQTLHVAGQILPKKDAEILKSKTLEDMKRAPASTGRALTGPDQRPLPEELLFSTTSTDGTTTEYYVSPDQVKSIPDWRPEKEDPPLSVQKAFATARAAAKKEHPKWDDVALWNADIMQADCTGARNKWFFVFNVAPVIEGERLYGGNFSIVVLMNGTVVGGRKKAK